MAKGRRDYTPEISSPIESQFILEDEVEVAKSPVQREVSSIVEFCQRDAVTTMFQCETGINANGIPALLSFRVSYVLVQYLGS